jgi:hypothetical protein
MPLNLLHVLHLLDARIRRVKVASSCPVRFVTHHCLNIRSHPNATGEGLPHRSLEDDIYNGMLIPKGSLVIANMRYECARLIRMTTKLHFLLLGL